MLVSDEGYDGAVLTLGRDFKRHSLEGDHLRTGAGVILAAIVRDAFSEGRTGLEFAVGIPGTVGGALAMNAGQPRGVDRLDRRVGDALRARGGPGRRARTRDRVGLPDERAAGPRNHRRGRAARGRGRCRPHPPHHGGEPATAQAHAAAFDAQRRQRLRQPRGRLGRPAHRGRRAQGRSRRRGRRSRTSTRTSSSTPAARPLPTWSRSSVSFATP